MFVELYTMPLIIMIYYEIQVDYVVQKDEAEKIMQKTISGHRFTSDLCLCDACVTILYF